MQEFNDWAMYDDAGNLAVTQMMYEIKQAISRKPLPEVRQQLHQLIEEVAKKHSEIYDTEVRDIISSRLTRWACEVHDLDSVFGLKSNYWDL